MHKHYFFCHVCTGILSHILLKSDCYFAYVEIRMKRLLKLICGSSQFKMDTMNMYNYFNALVSL